MKNRPFSIIRAIRPGNVVWKPAAIRAHAAQQVQDEQDPLGREVAVGDQADEQRRDDRPDRRHGAQPADLPARKAQRGGIPGDGHTPAAPEKELQEHHDRQAGSHQRRMRGTHGVLLAECGWSRAELPWIIPECPQRSIADETAPGFEENGFLDKGMGTRE